MLSNMEFTLDMLSLSHFFLLLYLPFPFPFYFGVCLVKGGMLEFIICEKLERNLMLILSNLWSMG